MADETPGRTGFVGLLLDRWKWWVIPLLVMTVATIILALAGRGTQLEPVRYDVPTQSSPGR